MRKGIMYFGDSSTFVHTSSRIRCQRHAHTGFVFFGRYPARRIGCARGPVLARMVPEAMVDELRREAHRLGAALAAAALRRLDGGCGAGALGGEAVGPGAGGDGGRASARCPSSCAALAAAAREA